MRILLALILSMGASTAFAGVESMSWEEILSQPSRYEVERDTIFFQNGALWLSSMDGRLCQDGTFYYAGTTTKCVPTGLNSGDGCKNVEVDLIQPLVSEKTVCTEFSNKDVCSKEETGAFKQSPVRQITIRRPGTSKDLGDGLVLGVKEYVVPTCED